MGTDVELKRAAVRTSEKLRELMDMGFSADELATVAGTTGTSIYARRTKDPGRRGDLDKRIGALYVVVLEMEAFGLDDEQIAGWFTSPSLHLDAEIPLESLADGAGQLKVVRQAAKAWMDGVPPQLNNASIGPTPPAQTSPEQEGQDEAASHHSQAVAV